METVYRDYSSRGVKFFYIYKALAHPETNGYVAPFDLKERLLHVKEAERRLGSKIPWLCDTMENDVKHSLGDAPNSEFIIGPDGNVVVRRVWSRPDELRKDLERLVGPVERPTTVAELDLRVEPPPKGAAQGVVPRMKIDDRLTALSIEPQESSLPFYVKLRAEASETLLRTGRGKLYLGFHIDPLYHVHWNNLAAPLKYEVIVGDGDSLSPATGEGPKVEVAADIDPREFLIDVEQIDRNRSARVIVSYFACHDEEGWCRPVKQEYDIVWVADRDAGWSQTRGRRERAPGNNAPGRPFPMRRPNAPAAGMTRVPGVVEKLDSATRLLTVRAPGGDARTFELAEDVFIVRNGRPGRPIKDLMPGDQVMLGVDSEDLESETPVVRRLMARSP